MSANRAVRVLYSFPHKLGAARICYTAWQQVQGIAQAGADVLACPGVLHKAVDPSVTVRPTLAWRKARIPYKLAGRRIFALHDWIVARKVERLAGQIDIVHVWSLASRETLKAAARVGIPTVLERPNAHTRFAMETVREECQRLGVALPPEHEHAYNEATILQEEEEYELAYRILCPSEFVVKTFLDKGFPMEKLVRHQYGCDEKVYYPAAPAKKEKRGLTMLFAGVCAVRKGLHFALEAWLQSGAQREGTFLIAGDFLPAYAEKLAPMLSHPSVHVLGHRTDIPELMRQSDVLVLPSIEEGYGLVVADAMASGCVPLTSDACTEISRHMETGLVHRIGDVKALTQHIAAVAENPALLAKLRANCLNNLRQITWTAAGVRLVEAYQETLASYRNDDVAVHHPIAVDIMRRTQGSLT